MKTKLMILSAVLVSGFVVSACSETPEEKVRREVREDCEKAKFLAPPDFPKIELEKMIAECVEGETQRKLEELNQPPHN